MPTLWCLIVAAVLACASRAAFADPSPLREIGYVRATTVFRTDFSERSAPAIAASIDFENRLLLTKIDLATGEAGTAIARNRMLRTFQDDVRQLADDARAAGAELAVLRETSRIRVPATDRAVVRFAYVVGTLEEQSMESNLATADVLPRNAGSCS